MTLILTELSPVGVVMATDSAFTTGRPGGPRSVIYGRKVFPVPFLRAGLSLWGNHLPQDPEHWVRDFIADQERRSCPDLQTFAHALATAMMAEWSNPVPTSTNQSTVGVHLVAYGTSGFPMLYHVHNGESQVLSQRGIQVDPNLVNANLDLPETVTRGNFTHPHLPIAFMQWRNGEIRMKAMIDNLLGPMFNALDPRIGGSGIQLPWGILRMPRGDTLRDRAEGVAAQIKLVADIYQASNIAQLLGSTAPHIGGDVRVLEFDATTPPGETRVVYHG